MTQNMFRSVLNAVNRQRPELALIHRRDDARPKDAELPAPMADYHGEPEPDWSKYSTDEFNQLRMYLLILSDGKPLPDGALHDLAGTLEPNQTLERRVEISNKGAVTFVDSIRFTTDNAAVAYGVLRLSQLNAHERVLLCCAECETLVLIPATGGDRMTRFCSTKCRNKFNQRIWRRDHPTPAAKKRKRKKK